MDSSSSSEEIVWSQILEKGVFRFDRTEKDRANASPSLSFVDPRKRETPFIDDENENIPSSSPLYLPQWSLLGDQQRISIQVT